MNIKLTDISNEILSTLSLVSIPTTRRLSDDIEVSVIPNVIINKQKIEECRDAYFNEQLIEERQKEIEDIESLMFNLCEMVKELSQTVENQDEKFVSIEKNARATNKNTKKAQAEIKFAADNRNLANNKM